VLGAECLFSEPFAEAFAGAPDPCAAGEAFDTGGELLPEPPQPAITTARSTPTVASVADALRILDGFVWSIVIGSHAPVAVARSAIVVSIAVSAVVLRNPSTCMVGVSASVVMRTVRRGASRQSRDRGGPEYHCAGGNKPVQLVSEHCVPFGDGRWWLVRVKRFTLSRHVPL
jgi:hypothetical protein